MPKGVPWSKSEVDELLTLRTSGATVRQIAQKMGKSEQAVQKKIERLGLKVVQPQNICSTTTSELIMPEELPSIEEALKILAAAMNALQTPGLTKAEVQRLRNIIQGCKIYKELLADYVNYRQIEAKLVEMEQKYAEWATNVKKDSYF